MKIRFTRRKSIFGEAAYQYENETHRYVTTKDDEWWVTHIYVLERVGTMDPPLMIGGRCVGTLMSFSLREAREEIALDVAKRA